MVVELVDETINADNLKERKQDMVVKNGCFKFV